MDIRAALIGGTGIGVRLLEGAAAPIHVPTRFGMLRGRLRSDGILLAARHGSGHRAPPHRVNYLAVAEGLRTLGIEYCFASAAVGGLRRDMKAGDMAVCSDFIELTGRTCTRFEDTVAHTDFTQPFDVDAHNALISAASERGIELRKTCVYVSANGPRYETPAEIEFYQKIGGDVVGMTIGTEAIAMREAGIKYACLAIISNLAAGISESPLSHDEVVAQMMKSGAAAADILLAAASKVAA